MIPYRPCSYPLVTAESAKFRYILTGMKKTITFFILVSLIASAAPPAPPTFSLDSCEPSATVIGACANPGNYYFSGENYSQHKTYTIFAVSDTGASFEIDTVVASDGLLSAEGFGVAGAGTWTFTIYNVNHNGAPVKTALGSATATFD